MLRRRYAANQSAVLKRFTKYEPIDMIGTRRKIAARLIQAERYVV